MIVTLDFETFYSQDYSLRKMSEVDYILSPLFQTIMCAVKLGDATTEVHIGHDAVAQRFAGIDWARAAVLAHNMRFDGSILSWHFGITPALYLDTLSMARAITHPVLGRSSLEAVSKYLGLPAKGDEVVRAMGKRLEDFTPEELQAYADYCVRDTENCRLIFDRLRPVVPTGELKLIDSVLRMFIAPQVRLDPHVLAAHLHNVQVERAAVMARVAHIDKAVFSSDQQFAALLESHGVEVPQKISSTTGKWTHALAKGDRAFKELCVDQDQSLEVQALLAARLDAKSTIEETRTQTLLNLSLREWPGHGQGWMPVPLKYYGAHTGRLSGDGGFNFQNLKRGSPVRGAIVAPEGYRIVHRDASQIEARGVAWMAGCERLLRAFGEGRDVYSEFASGVYQRPVTKRDVGDRFVGKTGILGLGYGCGAPKFRHMLFIGNGGQSKDIAEAEARRIVYHYRNTYPQIPALWERFAWVIDEMMHLRAPRARRRQSDLQTGAPIPGIGWSMDAVWLPNGMCVAYPEVRLERNADGTSETIYSGPYGPKKIYGGKMTENVCQALARIIVTDTAVRVAHSTRYEPFLSTHDSLDYCVPIEEVAAFDELLEREFAVRPTWAPDWPLASEGGWGRTLLEAEQKVNI